MRTIVRLVALTLAVLAFWALPSRPGLVAAATTTVGVDDDWFCDSSHTSTPCVTNISTGDTVHWVWTGLSPHSTTSDTLVWDSGVQSNGTFDHTFNTAGSFPYHCNIHSNMHGTIFVALAVGGIAELANVAGAPAAVPASSKGGSGLLAGVLAAGAGVVALAGAALYVRKLRVH